ncbi:TadE/TadG family type IV pilus assembly protein [Bosea sp. F3-2]|uniref:TadE/TadG family type IV pilus assembly protein n=1 Tax=Bosea sp. F3-2 TaxID=2599640 RepID=UPI0020C08AF6|nr:TadE/TadG family type IV pilus assembly protein [Bosea sp. F3-2]
MKRLDQRGVAAFEFTLIAVPLFTLMFVIFDLGRYAITVQSLHALANAEARAVMVNCYTPHKISNQSPSGCTTDYLSATDKQNAAPFLYAGGLTPTVAVATTAGGSPLTITATQPGFRMLVPVWGTALDAPSATSAIPF